MCYKAWNTNCNSLGSTLSALTFTQTEVDQQTLVDNLLSNIFEDAFYQAEIRMSLTQKVLPSLNLSYFDLKDQAPDVMDMIGHEMLALAQVYVPNSFAKKDFVIQELSSPWNRMFEINCRITKK